MEDVRLVMLKLSYLLSKNVAEEEKWWALNPIPIQPRSIVIAPKEIVHCPPVLLSVF